MIDYRIYESLLNRTNVVINQSIGLNNVIALEGLELMHDILGDIDVNGYKVILKDGEYHVNRNGVF